MSDILTAILPDAIPVWQSLLLIAVSFVTSGFTAAAGLGGGIAILAVMANLLPAAAVIPIHAGVQLGNNASRTVLNRGHVAWRWCGWFLVGALAGGAVAASVVVALPRAVLQLLLGGFVLFTVIGPRPANFSLGRVGILVGGAVTTFATFFVGATGPLVAAVMPVRRMSRHEVVATHGFLMVAQHTLKIIFFAAAGFAFTPWLGLLAAMVATGFAGAWCGRAVLRRVKEHHFQLVFKVVLVALALRLVVAGATGLLDG